MVNSHSGSVRDFNLIWSYSYDGKFADLAVRPGHLLPLLVSLILRAAPHWRSLTGLFTVCRAGCCCSAAQPVSSTYEHRDVAVTTVKVVGVTIGTTKAYNPPYKLYHWLIV